MSTRDRNAPNADDIQFAAQRLTTWLQDASVRVASVAKNESRTVSDRLQSAATTLSDCAALVQLVADGRLIVKPDDVNVFVMERHAVEQVSPPLHTYLIVWSESDPGNPWAGQFDGQYWWSMSDIGLQHVTHWAHFPGVKS